MPTTARASHRTARRLATALLAAAALAGGTGPAFAAQSSATVATTADRAALQRALDEAVAEGVPGAVVELRDGRGTWRSAAGTADLVDGRPAGARDRFRIGSVTKTFVATVVLQLVAEGRTGLDDPIERHLPGLVPNGSAITVRQLLSHTSGLADFNAELLAKPDPLRTARTATYTPRDLIAISTELGPRFAPGTSWAYSNTNYVVLGLLVEHLMGHRLDQEIDRRIVRPLHLDDTSFPTTADLPGPHLHGYEWADGPTAPPVDFTTFNPNAIWASGTMISTAGDLDRFYRALFAGRLLPANLLDQMRTPHPFDTGRAYGLGLESRTYCADGTPAWGHSGSVAGYETFSFTTADGTRQLTLSLNRNLTAAPQVNDTIGRILTLGLCSR
ncbi:serine hydrolase [Streptomyces sp. FH025]|uniref:serine hydrolase domain-containing protein n=1 Tax=Streptomyces sp. FH025 TaxID=2815937 RepID=UPI001A9E9F81|nr:serine hydrolase domain-containing protein [Streptomyces sp. FH025]MBO1419414.1 beta-lactamase family protein [Streptomyces sp. FH025]